MSTGGPHTVPTSYQEFLSQIEEVTRSGGGLTLDEDLYEEIFGDAALGGRGASESFIQSLPKVNESQMNPSSEATCPVCLHTLQSILTEEEYALAAEYYNGSLDDLGLRKLPCQGGHLICGKCARRWLTLNNTCPMCRATLDPSIPTSLPHLTPEDAANPHQGSEPINPEESDRLLRLFRSLFADPGVGGGGAGAGQTGGTGAEAGAGGGGGGAREERDEFVGMYS